MSKPIVVNLFAGSGCGKSTGAAYIFSQLKMAGVNCELVTEYAKDKTWEKATKIFDNQAYIFGKQYYRISRLEGEVDLIITDSPLLLSIVYNTNETLGMDFNEVVHKVFKSYKNINFFLNRVKPYNPKGRWQNESEAKEIDTLVKQMLLDYDIDFTVIDGSKNGYDIAVETILAELEGE
jgi:hypothetical protein